MKMPKRDRIKRPPHSGAFIRKMGGWGKYKESICCGANFMEPGWPDSDICSECKEHSGIDGFYDMDPIDLTRKQDKE